MAVKKIEHVGIMVKNLEESITFYKEVLQMELFDTIIHTNQVIKLAFLGFKDAKETVVELIEGYNADLPEEGKVHHIAFTVDNLEAEMDRLKKHNVTFLDENITTLPNGARYIFFYGPNRERIELFEVPVTTR